MKAGIRSLKNQQASPKPPDDERWELLEKKLLGSSEAMRNVRKAVLKYAQFREPVLILGENGVGKGLVAKLIHLLSGIPGKFVQVDSPNIKGDLLESKLFGYKKGAFTGADRDTPGFVDEARGGTLFFDEIAEVPLDIQARLLRFIDTHSYNVLGDPREKEADVRVIAATNRDIGSTLAAGEFREDLLHRINVFEILIPPLRERMGDIRDIVEKDSNVLKGKKYGEGFWSALKAYYWPGNVRELQTVLKRLAVEDCDPITGNDVQGCLNTFGHSLKAKHRFQDGPVQRIWDELMSGKSFWDAVKEPFLARDINRSQVRQIVLKGKAKSNRTLFDLLAGVNLPSTDYMKFKSFLYRNNILGRSDDP